MAYTLIIGGGTVGEAYKRLTNNSAIIITEDMMDVRDSRVVQSMLEATFRGSPISHVVFTAGYSQLDWIGELDDNALRTIETNLVGFINVMDSLVDIVDYPLRVTAISSDAAERPMRTSIAYCSSKAGLDMAVKVAARELGPQGWVVNAVAPGMLAGTGMTHKVDEMVPKVRGWTREQAQKYEDQQAVVPGRIPPEDIADAIHYLNTGSEYLNGTILNVNGGR